MVPKLRIQYPGAIHQVRDRGDRRNAIFVDNKDRQRVRKVSTAAFQGRSDAGPRGQCKGQPWDLKLAWELRSLTTMPLALPPERLNLSSRGHLAWLLLRRRQSQPSALADQCLLRI